MSMQKYQTMHYQLYYLPSHRLHRLGVLAPGWAGRQVQQTKKRGTTLACPTTNNPKDQNEGVRESKMGGSQQRS
jgi:hypothetical protein